jgi:hypothetical protein
MQAIYGSTNRTQAPRVVSLEADIGLNFLVIFGGASRIVLLCTENTPIVYLGSSSWSLKSLLFAMCVFFILTLYVLG